MYILIKRILDLIIAFIALIFVSPVLIPIIILLLLTGEHYVFYFQKRVGFHNSRFNIWKFATMLKASPGLGTGSLTLKNDARVLWAGKFLRQSKLNELPQLVNVFIGNMAIVGPRPQMEVDFFKFPDHIQHVIYNVKPGITGIGSIIFRDEEKMLSRAGGDPHEYYKTHIAPYKGELEVWYQSHLSLFTDVIILFLTVWVIIYPASELHFKIFKDLPAYPETLA